MYCVGVVTCQIMQSRHVGDSGECSIWNHKRRRVVDPVDGQPNHKGRPVLTSDIVHGGVEFPARMTLAMVIVGERERTGERVMSHVPRRGFRRHPLTNRPTMT